jgi:hypothetical protein
MRRSLYVLFGLVALAGCAGAPPPVVVTKIQVERVTVPAALLTVPDEPAVPVGATKQSQVADYIVRLKGNDDVCHATLEAISATQK